MGANDRRRTDDLLEILEDRYLKTPADRDQLAEAVFSAKIACQIYALRKNAGLTQRQLAKLVGTSHSVISRLEDDDYEGHSLSMLRRIGAAVGKRVEVRFVSDSDSPQG